MNVTTDNKINFDINSVVVCQQANNKFGKLLEENSALRKEIDSLRVERQRFDNLYKKLDKEKQDLQKETNEIIDQSTQAYDQRWENMAY
jgi:coiled-coil domain-containing protein 63/114